MDNDIRERYKVPRQRATRRSPLTPLEPQPQPKPAKKSRKWLKTLPVNLLRLLILASISAGVFFGFRHYYGQTKNQTAVNPLVVIQPSVNFPLYYPSQLPPGFKLKRGSDSYTDTKTGKVVTFSLQYVTGNMVVTEQRKPRVTEEVVKTKEFNTNIGNAYIADLNGHTVGFIKTNKTLIILSSTDNLDGNQLQQIMMSFQQAN